MTRPSAGDPAITFGMIVLNGEPFTRYNLRALYPFAHEILVVEGACRSARSVARPDGHSSDGTVEVLRRFQAEEDPARKVVVITAEEEGYPDGFWPEKDEMSQAYARRATGRYLWQVDSDEFYQPGHLHGVLEMLAVNPEITAVTFPMLTFWGGLGYRTDSIYLGTVMREVHRIFAWGPGYQYVTHRPPTVIDDRGRDLRRGRWITAAEMAKRDIYLYHYELLLPKQVREKCAYYANAACLSRLPDLRGWAERCFFTLGDPYRVHMVYDSPSWLERYRGQHPPQVEQMVAAVRRGDHPGVELRPTEDIEALLRAPTYWLGRAAIKARRALRHGPRHAAKRLLWRAFGKTPLWAALRAIRDRSR